MKRHYLSTIVIFLLALVIFSSSLIYAQEPQLMTELPITDAPQEEQRCMPVNPDELEGVSGEELIQRWQNYANCKEIDLDSPLGNPCRLDNKVWFMSSHEIILSDGLDPDLEEYTKRVPKNHLIPVVIQVKCDISTNELIELIELGQRYYEGSALQNNAYLTFIPAKNIEKIANKHYIEGLTLFKPSFKYNKIPSINEKVTTYVNTIEKTKAYHESDLKEIGVDVLSYDDVLKLYVVKMAPSQYNNVANLEWTKLITIVPESVPESQLIEATDRSSNYVSKRTATLDESNLIIYIIVSMIFVIILVFVLLKIRKK